MKYLKKGIKTASEYYPVYYSYSEEGTTIKEPFITISAKSIIKGLPEELNPTNNSDIMTDYFERDAVRILSTDERFEALSKYCYNFNN